jgi:hypothetical protein
MLAAGAALAGVAVAGAGEAAPGTSAADAPACEPVLKGGGFTLNADGSGELRDASISFTIDEWHTGAHGEIVIDRATVLETGVELSEYLRGFWQQQSTHTFIFRSDGFIAPAGGFVSKL